MKRRIDTKLGIGELHAYARAVEAGEIFDPARMRTAVRFALEEFAARYPGRSVEIRIPWIGAVQAISGTNHRRGTPPNVVEMDGDTWLHLVLGLPADDARMTFSGVHADLRPFMPLFQDMQI